MTKTEKALLVFLASPHTRAMLDVIDPKAVKQALEAIRVDKGKALADALVFDVEPRNAWRSLAQKLGEVYMMAGDSMEPAMDLSFPLTTKDVV